MELLIVDTSRIQSYIFGSNRLRENIGASYLVHQATHDWIVRRLPEPNNIRRLANGEVDWATPFDDAKRIEDGKLAAEALTIGGGNAALLFQRQEEAAAFVRAYTRTVLCRAPNLQVVIAHQPFTWLKNDNGLHATMQALLRELEDRKRDRSYTAPLLGLGVTAMCQSTGLPATDMTGQIPGAEDDTQYPASSESLAKLDQFDDANKRLRESLRPREGNHRYPYQLDNLGRSRDEHSYIAIIHADGDGIGQRLLDLGNSAQDNRTYIETRRRFSEALKDSAQQALRQTADRLFELIVNHEIVHYNAFGEEVASVRLQPERQGKQKQLTGNYFLPLRPIVFGGDDLTLVCDGRLGLDLARLYIGNFADTSRSLGEVDGQGGATASAGVAIVKSHFPFARAYALAEELAGEAKSYRRHLKQIGSDELIPGCLDWYFAHSGLTGKLMEIRRRNYCVRDGSLTLRPVTVGSNPHASYRAWQVVRKGVDHFQDALGVADYTKPPVWSGKRNKAKALRDSLRIGREEVKRFMVAFGIEQLPDVGIGSAFREGGWHQNYCAYFDALELADWLIPLQ